MESFSSFPANAASSLPVNTALELSQMQYSMFHCKGHSGKGDRGVHRQLLNGIVCFSYLPTDKKHLSVGILAIFVVSFVASVFMVFILCGRLGCAQSPVTLL